MSTSGRGWSGAPQHSKPAADYDIRYGTDLLHQESARWPRYVVVSTPGPTKPRNRIWPNRRRALVTPNCWTGMICKR